MRRVVGLLTLLTAVTSWQARAEGVTDCKDALVMSTMNKSSMSNSDYRLASLVTKDEYDKRDQSAGVNVVIYGVPVGANWSDFQENIRKYTNAYSTSLTTSQADNLMWTGLDPNSITAYSECLKAKVTETVGLHLVVESATETDVTLNAVWKTNAALSQVIRPMWQTATGEMINKVPKQVNSGGNRFSVLRPAHQLTLNVGFQGFTSGVTIEPLPKQPPRPQYAVDGMWCTTGPIRATMYLHTTAGHLDQYVYSMPERYVDIGYAGYYFTNRPSTEVPLFNNRTFLTNGNMFSIIDQYSGTTDASHAHDWRSTEYTYKFIDTNTIQLVHSLVQDQSGVAGEGLAEKGPYTRCNDPLPQVIEPGNGLWKSALPVFRTGLRPPGQGPLR